MRNMISGGKFVAIAYVWNQNSALYFISTCGSIEPNLIKYKTKFENDRGNDVPWDINHPKIAHFL
jgi:hypothetical protein